MSVEPSRIIADNVTDGTAGAQASTSATSAAGSVTVPRSWREAGPWPYQLLVILWFLILLAPFKLIPYYIPPARPLSWLPELLLWVCAFKWLRWPTPKHGYPAYTAFMVLLVFGIAVAYFLGNWGEARGTVRVVYQYYLLGIITLTFCTTAERARPILAIYFASFLWYGVWGLISLKTSPLGANMDPSVRTIIGWHQEYDNRDAFGPLMVAGLAYSIYYLQAHRAIRTRARTALATSSIGLCALGFITSFGRGAFLGFLAAAISMWLRSRRKLTVVVGLIGAILGLSFIAPQLASRYVATMQSITGEGTQTGTGKDRAELWGIAWQEFLSSPMFGVGTSNYGPAAQRVVGAEETTAGGYTLGRLFERVPHSAPMRILAEFGLAGALVACIIVLDFFRTNRRTRAHARTQPDSQADDPEGFPAGYVNATALGLHAAFLSICVSSIFYELLYSPLIWNVIVLNRMLYFASGASVRYQRNPL